MPLGPAVQIIPIPLSVSKGGLKRLGNWGVVAPEDSPHPERGL